MYGSMRFAATSAVAMPAGALLTSCAAHHCPGHIPLLNNNLARRKQTCSQTFLLMRRTPLKS